MLQEDYKLLENLNKATASKYSDMRQISTNVARSLNDLNDKCKLVLLFRVAKSDIALFSYFIH